MAVGAIEPQFFAQLLAGLGLSASDVPNQLDAAAFPAVHKLFAEKFADKTREEWTKIFAGTDACVTPVLTWREATAERTPQGAVNIGDCQRRRPGRARTAVLAHTGRSGWLAAPTDHAPRRK